MAEDEIADAIPHLLADYAADCKDWTVVASEHWRKSRWERVDEILQAGFKCMTTAREVLFEKLMSPVFGGSPGRPADHLALVNLRSMMAHVLLAQARTAPKSIVAHTSKLIEAADPQRAELTGAEYDKVAPQTKTKDWYYTEAAYNLNAADEALRSTNAGTDDEPVSMSMGKSQSTLLSNIIALLTLISHPVSCPRPAQHRSPHGRPTATAPAAQRHCPLCTGEIVSPSCPTCTRLIGIGSSSVRPEKP